MRFFILSIVFFLPAPVMEAQAGCDGGLPVVDFGGWRGDPAALRGGFCLLDESGELWYQEGLPDWNSHNQMPTYFHTRAIWQSRGVIEQTAAVNQVSLEGYGGAVALNACALVGTPVWVRRNATEGWIEVMVADCVKREHLRYHTVHVESGIELQWELAERLGILEHRNEGGGIGWYGFEVCLAEDTVECAGVPVDYTDWYLEHERME